MPSKQYIACTRMYNVSLAVIALWDKLIRVAASLSGIALKITRHPFPNDIEELWKRPDLGLVFLCGRPFMLQGKRHRPIGVPLRTDAEYINAPMYHTVFLVREDSPYKTLEDTFGARFGWTAQHSHSGFMAPLQHLKAHSAGGWEALYAERIGPLHTPAMCLSALFENRVDVAPLDAYYRALLLRNNPEVLAGSRVVAATQAHPMPFFAASPEVDPRLCEDLHQGLLAASKEPDMADTLEKLCITGFARLDISTYAHLGDTG